MRGMLYLDLDNFPASVPYEKALEEFYSNDLRILAKKAFGDMDQLSKLPIDKQQSHILIPCPKITKTKNSTDMRLGCEIIKDLLTNPNVDVFVIASADSDYVPVIKEVKERGKECVLLTQNIKSMSSVLTDVADQVIVCEVTASKPKRDKHSRGKISELLGKIFAKAKEDVLPVSGINEYLMNNGYNYKEHGYVSFKQCMSTCLDTNTYTIDFESGIILLVKPRNK